MMNAMRSFFAGKCGMSGNRCRDNEAHYREENTVTGAS
jgi:hypothetical protein